LLGHGHPLVLATSWSNSAGLKALMKLSIASMIASVGVAGTAGWFRAPGQLAG
jgi:hypothetical protein